MSTSVVSRLTAVGFTAAVAVLVLGPLACDKLPPNFWPPSNCEGWRLAIDEMPAGEARDEAEAEFAERHPQGCPVTPPVTTTTTTTTTTVPTTQPPAPSVGGVLHGKPGLIVPGYENTLGAEVNRALVAVHPEHCSAGRCVARMNRQDFQAAVEEQLRKQGVWSGQHEKTTDEIAAARQPKDPWQGFHVYAATSDPNVGTMFFSTCPESGPCLERPGSSYRGAYVSPWADQPEVPGPAPTPDPTPDTGCGAPTPTPLAQWGMRCTPARPGTTRCDATPQVRGKDYCAAVGYTDGRSVCAVRPDCDPATEACRFPDRAACEALILGGDGVPHWTWSGNPSQWERRDNPNTVWVSTDAPGVLRVCDPAGHVCAQRVQP